MVAFAGACSSTTTTTTATVTKTAAAQTTTATATATATTTATATKTAAAETKTLTIAIVTPLTNFAVNVSMNFERAVIMAIDDQNAKGGVTIGGQNYNLAYIVRDDKFDTATAKSLAEEMVFNEKVPVIFGPSQNEGPALQPTTNENKVLMFCMSPIPEMCKPEYPYTFYLGGIQSQQYATVMEYITKFYPDAKKVVSFYGDLSDEPAQSAAAKQMCDYYDLEWSGMVKFPASTTDFAPYAQKLMAYDPDVIDLSGCGGALGSLEGTMVKQFREAGYTGIIDMPTVPPPGIMDTVPAEYMDKIVTNDININGSIVSAEYKSLVTRFQTQYNELPIDFFVQAYNGASAFFEFLDTQSTMDTEQWMQNFANYKWTGVFGEDAQWVGEPIFGINRALMTNFWTSEWKNGVLDTSYVNNLPTELWISK